MTLFDNNEYEQTSILDRPVICPNNFKKSKLIMKTFRVIEFIVFLGGIGIAFVIFFVNLLFLVPTWWSWALMILIPLTTTVMTMSHPNYHNTWESIKIRLKYRFQEKEYFGTIKNTVPPTENKKLIDKFSKFRKTEEK